MNIKELIEELQQHNPLARVLLSSDDEGSHYHDIGSFAMNHKVLYIYPEHKEAER